MFAVRMIADFDPVLYPDYARRWTGLVIYSHFVYTRAQAMNLLGHWKGRTTKPDEDEVSNLYYGEMPHMIRNVQLEIVDTNKDEVPYNGDQYPKEYAQWADALIAKLSL